MSVRKENVPRSATLFKGSPSQLPTAGFQLGYLPGQVEYRIHPLPGHLMREDRNVRERNIPIIYLSLYAAHLAVWATCNVNTSKDNLEKGNFFC